ncbi:putative lectin [Naematelia encephala]|uniref:Putative lectin n=1 Tax=Naematelia encephala TaxID=71784 RepID=A0A1Y2AWQ3_9TREE|nr:putative lectin [Naematelia encephala]
MILRCFTTTLMLGIVLAVGLVGAAEAGEDSLQGMIEKTVPLRTHSLAAPYVDSDLQNRWWDFGADAIINTNKHVRLTQDKPSQTGWLWSRMPLTVSNWQIDVEFKVDGKAHNLYGDGFAIWITKDRAQVGPVFGSVDYFTGLGIFFDTYANSRHAYQWPRVTAMLGDGKTAYDHDHDNAEHELAGCSENFRRRDVPTKARLTYIKGKMLQLKLQTKKPDQWTTCFEIEQDLPEAPFIGFSSLTGDVSDNHDIVSINTFSATLHPEFRNEKQSPMAADSSVAKRSGRGRATKESKSGAASWFLFLLKARRSLLFLP